MSNLIIMCDEVGAGRAQRCTSFHGQLKRNIGIASTMPPEERRRLNGSFVYEDTRMVGEKATKVENARDLLRMS